jgi:hypothetical protein
MNNYNKEKIYEELRNYHAHKLPEITNVEMEGIRNKFLFVEEEIVMMLVRFVNEKELYIDMASDLETLKTQLKLFSNSRKDRTMVDSISLKISKLSGIMLVAKTLITPNHPSGSIA